MGSVGDGGPQLAGLLQNETTFAFIYLLSSFSESWTLTFRGSLCDSLGTPLAVRGRLFLITMSRHLLVFYLAHIYVSISRSILSQF